jgi:hypothetical protein
MIFWVVVEEEEGVWVEHDRGSTLIIWVTVASIGPFLSHQRTVFCVAKVTSPRERGRERAKGERELRSLTFHPSPSYEGKG